MKGAPVDASPAFSDLLSQLLHTVCDISSTTTCSSSPSDHPKTVVQFAAFVGKLAPIFDEMRGNDVMDTPPMRRALGSLESELKRGRLLLESPLSSCSRAPAGGIEDAIHDIGRCLGLVLLASLDISPEIKEKIGALHKEMINASFDQLDPESSAQASEIEEGDCFLSTEDIVLVLKSASEEKLGAALSELSRLIRDNLLSNEWVIFKTVIPILLNRMGSAKHDSRLAIIVLLKTLASQSDQNKSMSDIGYLSTIVRSLTRDAEERREAVGLLLDLSHIQRVRQRLGKIQGCIVMLVSTLNGEDSSASSDAEELLTALSTNTQNILHMAEAGYFKPLVQHLENGSDMNKILMATALSRMELTDQSKAILGEDGAIETLVKMFQSGKLEAKLSSLSALQNLSTLKENVQRLITTRIVSALLQLLFSVTSILMTLREPASAILASIAQSELMLINQDIAQQMLSLLNLSSPVVQYHLLRALSSVVRHPRASKLRGKMRESGAIQLLLPFLTDTRAETRTVALTFLFNLLKDKSEDLIEQLGEAHLIIITRIISSATSEYEKAAAVGVISNIPINDKKVTDILRRADLLPTLIALVATLGPSPAAETRTWLLENIAGLLVRFTISSDKKLQRYSAEAGIVPCLLQLLSSGSHIAKATVATALAQMSQNTLSLSKAKSSKWICIPPSSDAYCEVHDGYCSVRSTFCLVKAGAISPLIQIIEGKEREADEAALGALSTLLQDGIYENGSKAIEKASGLQAIVRILELGSGKAVEKAIWMLERIFRVETHRSHYGESAQVLLIDLAQRNDPILKPMIAKVLAHLQLLQMQSSYF